MFTGIVSDVGEVLDRTGGRFTISTTYAPETIAIGSSIACDGCCLSVTHVAPYKGGAAFAVDVSNETLSKTTLGFWQPRRKINLERALRAGDELGGHLVAGHVDAVANILDVSDDGASRRVLLEIPGHLASFIAPKGSVALDGTSLTVNEVEGPRFGVNIIPLTLTATTWGSKRPEDKLNLEIDLLARYVARLLEHRP